MENELVIQDKKIVTPGTLLATGTEYIPGSGCYRVNSEIKSKLLGLTRIKDKLINIISLSGVYMPKSGDGIIATVHDMQSTFWIMDINSPYDAILQLGEAVSEYVDISKTDISVYYDIGDIIYAKILNVSKSKSILLTMNDPRAKKLFGGKIISISPSKVPRLIGKQGSMIELIKNKTGCQIVVGQNGRVWLKGQNEILATKAVLKVENEAHLNGLTDRITEMLNKEGGIIENNNSERGETNE
ncbi:MAG: RNA-binding protein [Candidatus Aenigmarchaeota archaeon]|nr:RNA-binding protein [Candidatus Aenigmarchaeota archaeon]